MEVDDILNGVRFEEKHERQRLKSKKKESLFLTGLVDVEELLRYQNQLQFFGLVLENDWKLVMNLAVCIIDSMTKFTVKDLDEDDSVVSKISLQSKFKTKHQKDGETVYDHKVERKQCSFKVCFALKKMIEKFF